MILVQAMRRLLSARATREDGRRLAGIPVFAGASALIIKRADHAGIKEFARWQSARSNRVEPGQTGMAGGSNPRKSLISTITAVISRYLFKLNVNQVCHE